MGILVACLCLWGQVTTSRGAPPIVINEIMYHLKATEHKEASDAEFIELHYRADGRSEVSLRGWSFDAGVRFTFPEVTMKPGDFLVIASNLDSFRQRHPGVEKVIGNFDGSLSNSGETLRLEDGDGELVDEVRYADSGPWARQVSGKLRGYDDWVWSAPHDGEGHSLELIQAKLTNDFAHNWAASRSAGGSPGAANGVASDNVAPLITFLSHHPPIPDSKTPVTLRTAFVDDDYEGHAITAYYRQDGASAFTPVVMELRGGSDTDTWEAQLPALPDKTIVQFYVEVRDGAGLVREFPPLQRTGTRLEPRQALYLYQVDDNHQAERFDDLKAKPCYRFITTAKEIQLLRDLGEMSGSNSAYDNHLTGTFIAYDGMNVEVRYQALVRIRGHGSRSAFPPGLRLSLSSDAPYDGVTDINLNTQYTQAQYLGTSIHRLAGFAAGRCTPVNMRMNGEDWANQGPPQFGCYVHNEVLDGDYVDNHFPGEEDGNLYRGVANANLNKVGSDLERYRTLYSKGNHSGDDDYSDILNLIEVLDQRESEENYLEEVAKVGDLEQWARYFALDTLLCNMEGGLPTGRGDDYCLFRRKDGRFIFIPYDLDSILGMGERGTNIERSIFTYGEVPGLRHVFAQPEFRRLYYAKIHELTDTVFNIGTLYPLIDDLLGGWIPTNDINQIKEYIPARIAAVLSQIESTTVVGSTLPLENGYHKAETLGFSLYGSFDMGAVEEVTVGGVQPRLNQRSGIWMLRVDERSGLVKPGINAIPVVMKDYRGAIVNESSISIWYDRSAVVEITDSIRPGENDHWKAEDGPFLLRGEVLVPVGVVLSIDPGTTVYAAPGASLRVAGHLKAAGQPNNRITFTADLRSDSPSTWQGLTLESVGGENVLAYCDFYDLEAGTKRACLTLTDASLEMQHVGVHRALGTVLAATRSSVDLHHSRWSLASGPADAGYVKADSSEIHVEQNVFAPTPGDAPALTLGSESDVIRVFGNGFQGGALPMIVIQGAAWIDGNAFSSGRPKSGEEGASIVQGLPADNMKLYLTRNRWRSEQLKLVDEAQAHLLDGNEPGGFSTFGYEPARATIAGAPDGSTPTRSVKLKVGGPGITAFKYRINDEPWSEAIEIGDPAAGYALALDDLGLGSYQVAVVGRNLLGEWQSETSPTKTARWSVDAQGSTVHLSEILAVNRNAVAVEGSYHDLIELTNDSDEIADISGYALTDDDDEPEKFVFPEGTTIAPRGFLTVVAESNGDGEGLFAGFALSGEGETLSLYGPAAEGRKRLDSVSFGLQAADYSIGRVSGRWVLCKPTFGAVNEVQVLADPGGLRIHEWMAAGSVAQPDEYIELVNSAESPVALVDLALTDNIPNQREHRYFPALSFMGPRAVSVFWADSDPEAGLTHLNFRLNSGGEMVGLVNREGKVLAFAAFGLQRPGQSMGRDERGQLAFFGQPSPGELEPGVALSSDAAYLLTNLRITELHYHPEGEGDDEFLELTNLGSRPVSLEGLKFVTGIDFVFPQITLGAGESVLVVHDLAAFEKRYGANLNVAGAYEGKLNNGGEAIALETAEGVVLVQFTYSDNWNRATDGKGRSLELAEAQANSLENRRVWKASAPRGGTPGAWSPSGKN